MGEVKITIKGRTSFVLTGKTGDTVMEVLNNQNRLYHAFPCGGNGRCGKCAIKVLEGDFPVTEEDRKFFPEYKLDRGYRLACRAVLKEDCVIEYKGALERSYEVQSAFVEIKKHMHGRRDRAARSEDLDRVRPVENYGIAIDVGTTTIAVCLVDVAAKKILHTHTLLNHQRRYGADVIARIHASNEGKKEALRRCIVGDLTECIVEIIRKSGLPPEKLQEVVIAGNTTMGHLLLGYSCKTLGVFPFTPVDISAKTLRFEEVFLGIAGLAGIAVHSSESLLQYLQEGLPHAMKILDRIRHVPVYFAPGISTYVGADIVSGLLHCRMNESSEVSLLIDLGTNGEMAIGNRDRILVTSTAAGPAFEGGNISCGTGSVEGAMCDVNITEDGVDVKTINDAPLAGICGTGVIAITSELLENGMMDETGKLEEPYFDDGYVLGRTAEDRVVSFTQKDVREIQLAKSAIRAGAETLILKYGIEKEDIANVYLAGGFGYHIDMDKAVKIGLLPEEFLGRVEAIGNSSLGGCVHTLYDQECKRQLDRICGISEEVSLSDDKNFQEFYMDYMLFEED